MPPPGNFDGRHAPRLLPGPYSVRPAAWRWERAVRLVGKKGRRRPDDLWVALAVRFLRDLARTERRADINVAYERLARYNPDFYWAWYWYVDPDGLLRDQLEAYLLSGLDPVAAAGRCGLPAGVGVVYHHLFFDVEGRLGSVPFVVNLIGGRRAHLPLSEVDCGTLWKLAAWTKGPLFLETVLAADTARRRLDDLAAADRAYDEFITDSLRARTIATVKALSAHRDGEVILIAYAKLREIRQKEAGSTASASAQEAYDLAQALGVAARYGGPAEAPRGLPAGEERAAEQIAGAIGWRTVEEYVPIDEVVYPADPAPPTGVEAKPCDP